LENHEKVFATARITINIVIMLGALRRLLGLAAAGVSSAEVSDTAWK
jgi:hypothetical protein